MAPLYLCRAARPLGALHRRSTFYEAGLVDPSGRLVAVLAYDAKRTRRALISAIFNHGPDVARLAGCGTDSDVDWDGQSYRIGKTGFAVRWTGATEHQRACEAHSAALAA